MEKGAAIAEKKLEVSDVELPDEEFKRIFIGGVGAGVTAIDLEKTFSPLGKVHAVEFVRANGRNFAFMDFEPSSVRSLAKLFSTYNGCTWKGGKLKLEIAKEHYLARLKREWEEDAKPASAPPPTEENLEFVRSRSSSQENSQIRIFFPNLGKVKPLPFKGTGKHKYSFQRIEVPPLPIHFCDCEEHSKSLETTSQKYLSPLSIVVNEKEQNMMTSVINKLMGGEKDERPSDRKTQVASDPKILSLCNEDIHSNETKVSDTDDDNLVINICVGAEDDILMQLKKGMTQVTPQESGFGNPQSSKGRLVQNKADSGRRKKSEVTNASSIKPNKKARLVSADGLSKPEAAHATAQKLTSISSAAEPVPSCTLISSEGQSWLQKSSWKDLVGGRGSSSFSISNVLSGLTSASPQMPKANGSETLASKKPESLDEKSKQKSPLNARITPKIPAETPNAQSQDNTNMSNAQPADGQPWLQKSSWKELVGGRSSSSSFSISNVLSGKANASDTVTTKKPESFGEKSKQKTPQNAQISPGINPNAPISSSGALEKECKESSSSVQGQTSGVQVCPFMRNAESEQQWSMAKAALSGYLKRNSNEGSASKFSKGKTPSRR
ncbi:hypothetical protein KFK09_006378 [Dendrobium nobile]|uniref:RRM domain-containing protein n=1 Tax=Dendrobium nobile TaxID=94219 RepID=A0A8T3BTH4_DENNO|nr:hypothetical protein KFK09_006378 [Dendrobium nobile]